MRTIAEALGMVSANHLIINGEVIVPRRQRRQ